MPVVASRTELDRLLEEQRTKISDAQSAACGWISFYIKDRLIELEALYPGHKFTFTQQVWSTGLTVDPPLYGHKDIDHFEPGFTTDDRELTPADERLLEVYKELGELTVMVEDEFHMNPGRITSDEEIEDFIT